MLDVSTREELQNVKRKTVGNSVVHEPACKRSKVSVTSKEKMLRRNMLLIMNYF